MIESGRGAKLRVILDANILISWAIAKEDSQSSPRRVTDWAFSGHCNLIVPEQLLDEVKAVGERPKLRNRIAIDRKEQLISVLEFLAIRGTEPTFVQSTPVRDGKDQYLLDTAVALRVDALVTGDRDLLQLSTEFGLTWIVTASEFAARFLD